MNKLFRVLLIALISALSGALIAYLKDEENWKNFKKNLKLYQSKFEKSKSNVKNKLQEYIVIK